MATYLALNIVFMAAIVVLLRIRPRRPSKAWLVMLVVLVLLTAVFDSLIIYYEVVAYDPRKISGLYIGHAPLEDFFYAILAAIIVPVLWHKFGESHVQHH